MKTIVNYIIFLSLLAFSSFGQKVKTKRIEVDTTIVKGANYFYKVYVDSNDLVIDGPFLGDLPNVNPTASITFPANAQTYDYGASVMTTITASDADGTVDSVQHSIDGTRIGVTTSEPYGYSLPTTTAGTFTYRATVYDDEGGSFYQEIDYTVNPLPVVDTTLFDSIVAYSFRTSGAIVVGGNWNEPNIGIDPAEGLLSSNLLDVSGSATGYDLYLLDEGTNGSSYASQRDTPTTPSVFPYNALNRGYKTDDKDTSIFQVQNMPADSIFHISAFFTTPDFATASDSAYILTADTTFLLTGLNNNRTTTQEFWVRTDGSGNLSFGILPIKAGATTNTDLAFYAFYIREYNPNYVYKYSGGPIVYTPVDPGNPSPLFMSMDNMQFATFSSRGEGYAYEDEIVDEAHFVDQTFEQSINFSNFTFNGTEYTGRINSGIELGNKLDKPSTRIGWPFPMEGYIWNKAKVAVDSLLFYQKGTLAEGSWDEKWYQVFGIRDSSDFAHPIPLTDKIFFTSTDDFLRVKSLNDTDYFEGFKVVRGKEDRNGIYGINNHDQALNLIFQMPDSTYGDSVAFNWGPVLRKNPRPIGDIAGGNGFRTGIPYLDTLRNVLGANYRCFDNYDNYLMSFEDGFAINPSNYFISGIFDYDTVDALGREIWALGQQEAYTASYNMKYLHEAGFKNIIFCIQQNDGTLYHLGVDPETPGRNGFWNYNGTALHSDKHFLFSDHPGTWNTIDSVIGYFDVGFDSVYDNRKAIIDAFKYPSYYNESYAAELNARPDYWKSSTLVGDSMAVNNDSKIFPKIDRDALLGMGEPTSRDSTLNNLNTWQTIGTFAYTWGCFMGNGTCTQSDVEDFLVPGQKYEMNIGASNWFTPGNEEDANWHNGQGNSRARTIGAEMAVCYDGARGTVQDIRGGYNVGVWTANPSAGGTGLGFPASFVVNGDWAQECLMWFKYYMDSTYTYQQQVQGIEYPVHPANGLPLERVPSKLMVELHDYPGKIDQAGLLKPQYYGTSNQYMAIAPELLMHDVNTGKFLQWLRANFPNALVALSEWGYSCQSRTTFGIFIEDIGRWNAETGKWEQIGNWGTRQVAEIMNFRMMLSPTFTQLFDISYHYEERDYAYAPANTETAYWEADSGGTYAKFNMMGVTTRNYQAHPGTPVAYSYMGAVADYIFDDYIRQDSIWQVRLRHKTDTTQILEVVYTPTINTDSVTTSINLLPTATNIIQLDINDGGYNATETDVPDTATKEESWNMEPIIYKYQII